MDKEDEEKQEHLVVSGDFQQAKKPLSERRVMSSPFLACESCPQGLVLSRFRGIGPITVLGHTPCSRV